MTLRILGPIWLFVVVGLLAAMPADAQPVCRDTCPPCVFGDCTARNKCIDDCRAAEAAANAVAAELAGLRDKAIARLESDRAAAERRIRTELDRQVAAAGAAIDAGMTSFRQALSYARAQVRGMAVGAVETGLHTQQEILANFSPRMNAVASCMAGSVPAPIQQAYGELRIQSQSWVTQTSAAVDTARLAIDNGRNEAEATATRLFGDPKTTLASISAPFDTLNSRAKAILAELKTPPSDAGAFKSRLEGHIKNGFTEIAGLGTSGVTAVQTAGATALGSIAAVRQGSQQRIAVASAAWRTAAQNAVAGVQRFDPARDVPSMRTLRARLRAEVPQWPKALSCLCQSVDVPPQRATSSAPMRDAANTLEDMTDAFCAASMVMSRLPQAPQKLAQLRAMRRQPPPIDTGFNAEAALSAPGRVQLASLAQTYEAFTTSRHVFDRIVADCVETRQSDGSRARICGGNEAMSNAGALTGKLLAAQAFRLGTTAAGSPEAAAALVALESTLHGMINIVTFADGTMPIFGLSDNQRVAGVRGLAVRGYVNAKLPNAEQNTIAASNDNEGKKKFFEAAGAPPGLDKGVYRFKERESPDDTFPTLVGLTAAYDVLKQRNLLPEGRRRIVEAAEAFGEYWTRPGARFQFRSLRGEHTWAGDASDNTNPFHLLQNLTFLKAVIYLSEDFRGDSSRVSAVKASYAELTGMVGRDRLRDPSMLALAALVTAPSRNAIREPMLYFYPAFTVDMWVLGGYLLVKYERDPAQREVYLEMYRRIVLPLSVDFRMAAHDLTSAATVTSGNQFVNAAGMTRTGAIARAAGSLRQYRPTPAPFANPLPDSSDPSNPGRYYTDFSQRSDLRDPLYFYLKGMWVTLRQQHPRVWDHLKDRDGFTTLFGEDQGSAWPLGQGLVPKGTNSGPYALIGGSWDTEHKRVDVVREYTTDGTGAVVKTLRTPSAVELIYAYWFGRAHGLLPAP